MGARHGHDRGACLNVRSPILTKSRRFHVCSEHGTRWGHDMVYRIGNRMSGHPSCITAECNAQQSVPGDETPHLIIAHSVEHATATSFYSGICGQQLHVVASIGRAGGAADHLCQNRRILCLHHGVDDALRMDHDVDVVV